VPFEPAGFDRQSRPLAWVADALQQEPPTFSQRPGVLMDCFSPALLGRPVDIMRPAPKHSAVAMLELYLERRQDLFGVGVGLMLIRASRLQHTQGRQSLTIDGFFEITPPITDYILLHGCFILTPGFRLPSCYRRHGVYRLVNGLMANKFFYIFYFLKYDINSKFSKEIYQLRTDTESFSEAARFTEAIIFMALGLRGNCSAFFSEGVAHGNSE
jgi:hypothetical protein